MITRLVLTYLHKEGYTSRKCAERLGVSKSTVLKQGRDFGLIFQNVHKKPNTIPAVFVKKLVRRGYSNKEIAKLLNTKSDIISVIKQRNNIKSSNYKLYDKYKEVNTDNEILSLIAGCLLGDGSISKDGRFSCAHSLAQKEYCIWKINMLKKQFNVSEYETSQFDKRTKKTYYSYRFYVCQANQTFRTWRENTYVPHKEITPFILKYYNNLSLAVHYMDDGYKTDCSYQIATNSFSKDSLELFIKHCKDSFGIEFKIASENKIYLPKKYKDRFENIIKPFIHSTLMYKLHCRRS